MIIKEKYDKPVEPTIVPIRSILSEAKYYLKFHLFVVVCLHQWVINDLPLVDRELDQNLELAAD